MDHPPGLPKQPTEPTEPKENDVFKVSEIVEDFHNLKMGFGQFHFALELKQDVEGGAAALQDEMIKLGLEKRYIGTIKIASESGGSRFPTPLPKGIYYCRYWKGRKGIHGEVREQSKKDAEDEWYNKIKNKSKE